MHGHITGGGLPHVPVRTEPPPLTPPTSLLSNTKSSRAASSRAVGCCSSSTPSTSDHHPPADGKKKKKKQAFQTQSFFRKMFCILSPPPPPKKPDETATAAVAVQILPPEPARRRELEFEGVFDYIDKNGDGKISPSELRTCLRAAGEELSQEEAEEMVRESDSDGDGLLGLDDFARLVAAGGEDERVGSLREAYAVYQAEGGSGVITPKSLRAALGRLGEKRSVEQCRAMIRRFDLDGDGVISFDEFKVMML